MSNTSRTSRNTNNKTQQLLKDLIQTIKKAQWHKCAIVLFKNSKGKEIIFPGAPLDDDKSLCGANWTQR
ncbi:hypothetical protein AB6F62_09865 [Providencia huaxiensis]|uniref:hypothetical protein n=1 Tax=Providencia huaxiensis TaxID=2027290 RepID=UPI0034DD987E